MKYNYLLFNRQVQRGYKFKLAARVILKRGLATLRGSTVGHTGSKASGVWTLVQTMKEESHVL